MRAIVYAESDQFTQKSVHRIFQDATGFLWFGTQDGAVRFDGVTWRSLSSDDGLGANHVAAIGQDAHGRVWFGTVGGGVAVQDAKTQGDHNGLQRLLEGADVRDLLCFDEEVWVATSHGVCCVRGAEVTWIESGLPSRDVTSLCRMRDGRLFAGTRSGVVLITDGRVATVCADLALGSFPTSCVFEDGGGDLWAGTLGGGLVRLPANGPARGYSSADGLANDHVMCGVRGGSADELWVGTWGAGVSQVRLRPLGSRCVFTTVSSKDGIGNDNIRSLCFDRDARLWIGTGGRGATCYTPSASSLAFVSYRKSDGLAHDMVACISQDSKGTFWFGSFGGGVCSFTPDARTGRLWHTYTTKDGLSHDTVRSLHVDAWDRVWFGTAGGGITRYRSDLNEWRKYGVAEGLAGTIVRTFAMVGDELWVGTDGGISCFSPEMMQPTRNFLPADGVPKGTVLAIVERNGEVWVGTLGGGVARYVNDQWIPVAGLPSEAITSLLPIDGGWLIGTYGSGLIRLREGVVTQLRQRDGLPHDIVYGLVHDSKKRVFGTGVRGVFELDWKEKDPLIRAYDHTDGLADDECNGGAVYCDRGGRLWFGTIGGASELSPAALETQGGNASALIIDVRVDRAPVNVANGVCITGREVIFEYGVVDFISPSKIVFQCRLEGYEREWLPLTSARTLRYTNLAPGKYTFMVRARGQSGVFGPTAMLECTS